MRTTRHHNKALGEKLKAQVACLRFAGGAGEGDPLQLELALTSNVGGSPSALREKLAHFLLSCGVEGATVKVMGPDEAPQQSGGAPESLAQQERRERQEHLDVLRDQAEQDPLITQLRQRFAARIARVEPIE
ncbi:hypothetical protein MAIT1_04615 [Magnetofaba australis IT-1]|uniref:Uncharacterized protein n=1 Tax=Magnetofaba australis IT-1 TaxID=1434232 RepID=A0A1Y2KAM1_9PROT|nr:hypothetical protein MAIT1_04615 [Magnetofaba australis IT-1]